MDEQRRGRRNLAQNLLITLLTLTAAGRRRKAFRPGG